MSNRAAFRCCLERTSRSREALLLPALKMARRLRLRGVGKTRMSHHRSFTWRAASGLAAHAANILPPERGEWSNAMVSEVSHLPSAGAAIRWSIGCVFAAYIERIRTMARPIGHVSPWVLSLEMLICFVPVTFLFVAVALSSLRGIWPGSTSLLYASATLIGPIGLFMSVRLVFFRQNAGRSMSAALCVLAAWSSLSYLTLVVGNHNNRTSDWWQIFVLIAILPAVGTAHLTLMAAEARRSRVA
jgi:hypothetical protein